MGPPGVYECTGDFGYLRRGRSTKLHALFYHKDDKIYFPMHCDCDTEAELKAQLKAAYPRWKATRAKRQAKVCTTVCSLSSRTASPRARLASLKSSVFVHRKERCCLMPNISSPTR